MRTRLQGALLMLVALLALPALASETLEYRLLDRFPHDRTVFTQGLLFHNGWLYESSGLYGRSHLRRYRPGDLEATVSDLPRQLFAEGIAVLDGQLHVLTWREHLLLRYDPDTLEPLGSQRLRGEAWGLTSDGRHLIVSDGSDRIVFRDPASLAVMARLRVREQGRPLRGLNELEWVEGWLLANVWREERIVVIDPVSGEVAAQIDLAALAAGENDAANPDQVANGIAWHAPDRSLWVTGKHWQYLYRLQIPAWPAKP